MINNIIIGYCVGESSYPQKQNPRTCIPVWFVRTFSRQPIGKCKNCKDECWLAQYLGYGEMGINGSFKYWNKWIKFYEKRDQLEKFFSIIITHETFHAILNKNLEANDKFHNISKQIIGL